MKKIILMLIPLLPLVVSCEKSIATYSGEAGIYIDGSSMNDSVGISFANIKEGVTNYEYEFRVNTMGRTTPYDRKFIIEKIDEYDPENQAIEGVDYESMKFGEYTIPAGESYLDITINFYRNPILLQGKSRKLSFRLVETSDFKFLYNRVFESERYEKHGEVTDTIKVFHYMDTQRCFRVSEEVKRQYWWPSGETGHSDLGKWSVKKSLLICEVMGLDKIAWFSGDSIGITSDAYLSYIGRTMHLWLKDHPTFEDEEKTIPMKMGPNAQD